MILVAWLAVWLLVWSGWPLPYTALMVLMISVFSGLLSLAAAAMIAGVLLLRAAWYFVQRDGLVLAEQSAVFFYYVLLVIVVRQVVDLLAETAVGRWPVAWVRRTENYCGYGIHRFSLWLLRLSGSILQLLHSVLLSPLGYRSRQAVRWLVRNSPRLFREHTAVIIVATILFLVPFFWFHNGEMDLGGDSSRLYFYDPGSWLRTMALHEINVGGYGFDNPAFFMLPFLALLWLLQVILPSGGSWLLEVFDGLLLSGAWLTMYGVIIELFSPPTAQQKDRTLRLAAMTGALFFIFSQIITFNWQKYPYSFHQIALYPLLFYLFLRYIKTKNFLYLTIGLLMTVVFSVNFSLGSGPVFFGLFPLVFVFMIGYALLHGRTKVLLRGGLIFLGLFILLNAFHLLPQLASLSAPSSNIYLNLFSEQNRIDRGLNYFNAVRPAVRLIYNLVGFHQYHLYQQYSSLPQLLALLNDYGVKYLYVFLLFPLVLVVGLAVFFTRQRPTRAREDSVFVWAVFFFLLTLFLMTANMFGEYGPAFYARLFYLPGFGMFRSFYGVFAVVFIFFYAIALGGALRFIFVKMPNTYWRYGLSGLVTAALLFNAWPFISGKIANIEMQDTVQVKISHAFRQGFGAIVDWLNREGSDSRLVAFPLTAFDYQIVEGEYGGAYVGPSPLSFLTGRSVFTGLGNFDAPDAQVFSHEFLLSRLATKDYRTLDRMFALMNVGYLFYNSSAEIYHDYFIGWPYSAELFALFPNVQAWQDFVDGLGWPLVYQQGHYMMYQNQDYELSRFYIPASAILYNEPVEMADRIIVDPDYEFSSVFYTRSAVPEELLPAVSSPAAETLPAVQVSKISFTRYAVQLERLTADTSLVFSQAWHRGWRAYPVASASASRGQSIDDRYHWHANEYAQAWWLDLEYLKNNFPEALRQEADGSFTLTLVVDFAPQKYFYFGATISIITLIILTVYSIYRVKRKHRSVKIIK
ncbi:hypothetical protein HY933_02410 [Candidatus Falkowbacteria bacterium]|nr:hypothetical protein [Candidatus Falkowbacteria bacterium]